MELQRPGMELQALSGRTPRPHHGGAILGVSQLRFLAASREPNGHLGRGQRRGGVSAVGFQGGVGVGRDWLQRMGSFGLSEVCSAQLKSSISLPRGGIPPNAVEEAPLETVQYSVPSSNPFHSVAQSLSFVRGELVGRRGSRSPSLRLTDPQFSEG